jgi:hypothetical protein
MEEAGNRSGPIPNSVVLCGQESTGVECTDVQMYRRVCGWGTPRRHRTARSGMTGKGDVEERIQKR